MLTAVANFYFNEISKSVLISSVCIGEPCFHLNWCGRKTELPNSEHESFLFQNDEGNLL